MSGTPEQHTKIAELERKGYKWSKELSCAYADVVYTKGNDIWIFDLEGGIHHNPPSVVIKC